MHTGARAREQKYISIYISLCMKTFLKTGVYIYIYIYEKMAYHHILDMLLDFFVLAKELICVIKFL